MSRKKPQQGKHPELPGDNHGSRKEESTKRHVYVEPGVKIDLVDGLIQQYTTAREQDTGHQKKQLFWTVVGACLVFLTAGFAGWQAYSSNIAARAAKDAAGIGRESLISAQRAFLIPNLPTIENLTEPTPAHGREPILRVHESWENTGSTIAPVAISYIHYDKIPQDQMATWPFKAKIDPPIRKMYAGSRTPLSTQATLIPVDDIKAEPNFVPVVWGWMAYRDIFPHTPVHVTEYCYSMEEVAEITEPGQPLKPYGPGMHHRRITWLVCARHNCIDENCEDYKDVAALLDK